MIQRTALDDVVAHARAAAPAECCGLLLGADGRIEIACPARNIVDPSDAQRRFLIDPRDHFAARRLARQNSLTVVGFYHSHPRTAARPSASDVAEAAYPDAVTLIVSLEGDAPEARLFQMRGAEVREISLELAPAAG